MAMQFISLQDYQIVKDYTFDVIPTSKTVINTINAHSWVTAEKDPTFKNALLVSDILLLDGIAIVLASKFLTGDKIHKTAGADLHEMILRTLNNKAGKCFYLGASKETLDKIKNKLHKEYPNIQVKTYSPPYKDTFSEQDNKLMIESINAFEPDVLFVGMTAPKQEKWIIENKSEIKASVITGIGAVFDFYAGVKKRPAKWMINCGLEWFGRLIQDPKRLWKRYLINNQIFIYQIIKIKLNNIFH